MICMDHPDCIFCWIWKFSFKKDKKDYALQSYLCNGHSILDINYYTKQKFELWKGKIFCNNLVLVVQRRRPLRFWKVFDINIMHQFYIVLNLVCCPIICSYRWKIFDCQRCWSNVQAAFPPCSMSARQDNGNNWSTCLQS